ncbi:MAG: (Fe-S)-binding protein [Promethearchaeota archaeon]|nr:MAG: (Fe-S)-binding protein [Candidatus Lokiarchaeota archaeon]
MNDIEKEEFYCPCREIDPEQFISNEEVKWLIENQDKYTFTQDDYYRVYNCIHCNDCGTSEDRFLLKRKFLDDGGIIPGLKDTIDALLTHGTPFIKNKSRVRIPEGIPKTSKTLLYLGCFTSVKTPIYAENLITYLLNKGIDFTFLEQETCCGYPILCNGAIDTYNELVEKNKEIFKDHGFTRIITVCPSCYMVFKKEYSEIVNIDVKYFTEYLSPAEIKKSGNLIIQHACPLRNGEIPGIVEKLEKLFSQSGYNVLEEVPNRCCGGGIGHQLRTDIIDAIALKRMEDFLENSGHFGEIDDDNNFITTYCPDAYWILKVYGRKKKIPFKLKDMCELLE